MLAVLSEEKTEGKAPQITELLIKWSNGDKAARDELIPLVYDELRRLAGRYLRRERQNCTLQTTVLVHDAYVLLVDQRKVSFHNRAQFFGLCAKIMRNILVDRARKKRLDPRYRISLSKADRINGKPDVDLLVLHLALDKFEAIYPRHALVVELRFFSGLTVEQTADVLRVSRATVEREWSFAKDWLKRELRR